MAVSFALGFGAAWLVRAPADDALASAPIAQASATGGYSAPNPFPDIGGSAGPGAKAQSAGLPDTATVDELWAKALLPPDRQEPGYDAEDRLRRMAQTNPVALRKLVQRYETDRSPQARELLKRKRFDQALELLKQALATEQSPEVLVQALQALKAGAAEPEEAAQIVAQLKTLTQHADAAVRRHSIMQLGQWDKKGEGADVLAQALADRSTEVRQAAIFAIAQNGVRTDAIKAALLALMSNPQESRDIRGSALQALERFSLTKEEYASVARAKAQLAGL